MNDIERKALELVNEVVREVTLMEPDKSDADNFRAALAKRGLEIREKGE